MTAWLRRAAALLAALVATVGVLLGSAPAAQAAYTVTFDRFDIDYVFDADGSARVTETVVARWGVGAGRHGIDRYLISREQYFEDESRDALHPIDDVRVTSPDPGVSTAIQVTETPSSANPRNAVTRIRIGDADKTITAPTATYVITYRQRGLTQAAADYDAINLDVLSDMGTVRSARVTVRVPGGAQEVECWAAPAGQRTPCSSKSVEGGVATFTQAPLAEDHVLTVATKLTKGAIPNAGPILVESATAERERLTRIGQVGGLAGALLVPILGFFYYRPRTRDDRFAGMPPGTFPPAGSPASIEPNRIPEVPVSFAPPRLPLMHAGYLLEGESKMAHLTATLVGLATSGAIQLSSGTQDDNHQPLAVPKEPAAIPDRPSALLYDGLFGGTTEPVLLSEAGSMAGIRSELYADTERSAAEAGWFRRIAVGRRSGVLMGALLVWLALSVFGGIGDQWIGLVLWLVIPIVLAWVITRLVAARFLKRGQRSAVGRAWTDQIEGFRTYIATAEAEQLRFNEGEDIFTKYLPWAILFGLAERWTQVCERAVQMGLLQQPDTYWYGGGAWDAHWLLWNLHAWDDSLATAATPLPDPSGPSFSTTDFGGGTGFGGGGGDFAGGGFGGGGADGW